MQWVENLKGVLSLDDIAKHYFSLGLDVTCIGSEENEHNRVCKNILKNPNHEWLSLFKKRQTMSLFHSLDWSKSVGVGSICGRNMRVLDLDGTTNIGIVESTLEVLGLPSNYEWVVRSGSMRGFHVYFQASKPDWVELETTVTTFTPLPVHQSILEKLEILWMTHVVLPPSRHASGHQYSFLNCLAPRQLPLVVENREVEQFIDRYCQRESAVHGTSYGG